jgi:O-antigen ligase
LRSYYTPAVSLVQQFRTFSGTVYLSILAAGVVLTQYASYLGQGEPVFKGQSAAIILFFVAFGIAFLFWLGLKNRVRASGLLSWFLILMSFAWFAHVILYRIHSDAFTYSALLYFPILVMIWLKPPGSREAWSAILAFAWTVAGVLVLTRILEMLGVLARKAQPPGVIEFDIENYFLPVNDLLGIDGRWSGPFGHNGPTAMMGAMLIVIAVSHWTRASWVFIVVGGFTLLVTSGRASMGAVIAAFVVLTVFSKHDRITRIPQRIRIWSGLAVLLAGAVFMYTRTAGVTGRSAFWPAFWELWESSPLVGVGTSGISISGGITQQFGHAHNLYLDELARYGLLGFVTQFAAIAVGVVIAFIAAKRGVAGPLAILAAYLVTGVTEPRNDWINPSVTGMLVILAVTTAAAALESKKDRLDVVDLEN